MSVQQAYNSWAEQYDTNENKTRDLEAKCIRETLEHVDFDRCLEIGCGTGKNTQWLLQKANKVIAVDLSEEMLAKARQKIQAASVNFVQANIKEHWQFEQNSFDLVTFSLVLEHIEDLNHIFAQAQKVLARGGYLYIGELHPFKQYLGSKARFETEQGVQVVECYNHHVSEFINTAEAHGLALMSLNEYFDEDQAAIPRILCLMFRKP